MMFFPENSPVLRNPRHSNHFRKTQPIDHILNQFMPYLSNVHFNINLLSTSSAISYYHPIFPIMFFQQEVSMPLVFLCVLHVSITLYFSSPP